MAYVAAPEDLLTASGMVELRYPTIRDDAYAPEAIGTRYPIALDPVIGGATIPTTGQLWPRGA